MAGTQATERILKLIMELLHAPGPLTGQELTERVGMYPPYEQTAAWRRMFERDKKELRDSGLPLQVKMITEMDPPVEGYWVDAREYYLDDPGLTVEELAAIELARSLVRIEGVDEGGVEGLWKLGGIVGGGDDLRTEVALPGTPGLTQILEAIRDRCVLTFTYSGLEREVDPWTYGYSRGRWYLKGFDRTREAERLFVVERIEGGLSLGEPGSASPVPEGTGIDLPDTSWKFEIDEPVTAVLRVDADRAPFARVQLERGGAEVVDEPDGSITATVEVTNRLGFRAFVLDLLDHAEILAPDELREDLLEWLETVG